MMRKIILDCDPGHDDALAMLLAHANPNIDLLLITTVAGNQTVDKTTRNALNVAQLAGIPTPVAKGLSCSILGTQMVAPEIHGESGMDGPVFPTSDARPIQSHAVEAIIETLMGSDGDITLVCVGPLSNIGAALVREPKIASKIQEIVLMGGATYFGNKTPAAEFNIVVDPEAARLVFESGIPITMVGLELTHQATATADVVQRIEAINGPVAKLALELLEFFGSTYKRVFGFDAPPIHDACAVAYVIDPDVFTTGHYHVDIETKGEFTAGMTVVDLYGVMEKPANVKVALKLDKDRFWDLMLDALARCGDVS